MQSTLKESLKLFQIAESDKTMDTQKIVLTLRELMSHQRASIKLLETIVDEVQKSVEEIEPSSQKEVPLRKKADNDLSLLSKKEREQMKEFIKSLGLTQIEFCRIVNLKVFNAKNSLLDTVSPANVSAILSGRKPIKIRKINSVRKAIEELKRTRSLAVKESQSDDTKIN